MQLCVRWCCCTTWTRPLTLAQTAPPPVPPPTPHSLMRFKDDIVVVVSPDEGGATARVDARSRSRIGQGDMGANGGRLRRYIAQLKAALEARQLKVLS